MDITAIATNPNSDTDLQDFEWIDNSSYEGGKMNVQDRLYGRCRTTGVDNSDCSTDGYYPPQATEMEGLRVQLEREKERANVLEGAYEKLVLDIQKSGAVDYMLQVQHSPKISKMKDLGREHFELRQSLDDCKFSLRNAQRELDSKKRSVEKLLRSKKDIDKQLFDCESEVRANKNVISDLEHKNRLLCREMERCRYEYESCKKKLEAIESANYQFETDCGILTKEIGNNKEDYNRKLMFLEDRCKEAVAKFNQLMEKNKQLEAKVIKLEDEAKDLRLEIEKKAGEISFLYNLSLITREKSHKDVEENMKRLSVNFELGVASKAENSNKFLNDKAELIQNYDKKIDELENKIRNELEGKYQLKEQYNNEMRLIHSTYSEKLEKLEMNFEKKLKLKDEVIYMAHLKARDVQTECNQRIEEMISVMKGETDEIRSIYEEAARGAGENMNQQLGRIYENFKQVLIKQQRDLSVMRQYGRTWNRDMAQGNGDMTNEDHTYCGLSLKMLPTWMGSETLEPPFDTTRPTPEDSALLNESGRGSTVTLYNEAEKETISIE